MTTTTQATPPSIHFERFLRDCPFNDRKVEAGDKHGRLYDFRVFINGELRGYWKAIGHRRGYEFYDLGFKIVRAPYIKGDGTRHDDDPRYRWRVVEARAQGQFTEMVVQELDYIPTLGQIKQRQHEEDEAAKAAAAQEAAAQRLARIRAAAPKMLEALCIAEQALAREFAKTEAQGDDRHAENRLRGELIAVRDAIHEARGDN